MVQMHQDEEDVEMVMSVIDDTKEYSAPDASDMLLGK